jgi:uncharacterized metal-binding protein (TIGR02443 family)
MTVKRVFIAGAVCQKCGAIDRVQRCKDDTQDDYWIECVACGFRQELSTDPDQEVKANDNWSDESVPQLRELDHR